MFSPFMVHRTSGAWTIAMKWALLFLALVCLWPTPGCKPHYTLSVGTLHTAYALPLRLATSNEKPIFNESELTVNIVYFQDSSQMEAALLDGKIDAALDDLASAIALNKDAEQIKVVMTAMRVYPSAAMWAIVASPHNPIASDADLYRSRVAIPKGISARYVGHQLLRARRIDPGRVTWLEVTEGWQALAELEAGRAMAALLPEPVLSMAVEKGSKVIVDDRYIMSSQLAILFSQTMVKERPRAIRRFTKAYEQAMWELNRNAENYRALMKEIGQLPPEIGEKLPMPLFPYPAEIPTETEVEAISLWLAKEGTLSQPIPYRKVVETEFRPPPEQFVPARCCL